MGKNKNNNKAKAAAESSAAKPQILQSTGASGSDTISGTSNVLNSESNIPAKESSNSPLEESHLATKPSVIEVLQPKIADAVVANQLASGPGVDEASKKKNRKQNNKEKGYPEENNNKSTLVTTDVSGPAKIVDNIQSVNFSVPTEIQTDKKNEDSSKPEIGNSVSTATEKIAASPKNSPERRTQKAKADKVDAKDAEEKATIQTDKIAASPKNSPERRTQKVKADKVDSKDAEEKATIQTDKIAASPKNSPERRTQKAKADKVDAEEKATSADNVIEAKVAESTEQASILREQRQREADAFAKQVRIEEEEAAAKLRQTELLVEQLRAEANRAEWIASQVEEGRLEALRLSEARKAQKEAQMREQQRSPTQSELTLRVKKAPVSDGDVAASAVSDNVEEKESAAPQVTNNESEAPQVISETILKCDTEQQNAVASGDDNCQFQQTEESNPQPEPSIQPERGGSVVPRDSWASWKTTAAGVALAVIAGFGFTYLRSRPTR